MQSVIRCNAFFYTPVSLFIHRVFPRGREGVSACAVQRGRCWCGKTITSLPSRDGVTEPPGSVFQIICLVQSLLSNPLFFSQYKKKFVNHKTPEEPGERATYHIYTSHAASPSPSCSSGVLGAQQTPRSKQAGRPGTKMRHGSPSALHRVHHHVVVSMQQDGMLALDTMVSGSRGRKGQHYSRI